MENFYKTENHLIFEDFIENNKHHKKEIKRIVESLNVKNEKDGYDKLISETLKMNGLNKFLEYIANVMVADEEDKKELRRMSYDLIDYQDRYYKRPFKKGEFIYYQIVGVDKYITESFCGIMKQDLEPPYELEQYATTIIESSKPKLNGKMYYDVKTKAYSLIRKATDKEIRKLKNGLWLEKYVWDCENKRLIDMDMPNENNMDLD